MGARRRASGRSSAAKVRSITATSGGSPASSSALLARFRRSGQNHRARIHERLFVQRLHHGGFIAQRVSEPSWSSSAAISAAAATGRRSPRGRGLRGQAGFRCRPGNRGLEWPSQSGCSGLQGCAHVASAASAAGRRRRGESRCRWPHRRWPSPAAPAANSSRCRK